MGESHVGADDQYAIALLDVFVIAWRRIGTQAAFVAHHRRAHAQARVAVDIVGADQGAGQLVEGVVVLGQQLAADIEGHAVRAVFANGFGEYIFMVGDGPAWCSIIPADDAAVCEQNEVVAEYQPIPSRYGGKTERRRLHMVTCPQRTVSPPYSSRNQ